MSIHTRFDGMKNDDIRDDIYVHYIEDEIITHKQGCTEHLSQRFWSIVSKSNIRSRSKISHIPFQCRRKFHLKLDLRVILYYKHEIFFSFILN
jgi:hypothetical protein